MRRSDLLTIVGMTNTTFDALVARGVTPFDRSLGRKWSVFTVEDALRLVIFLELTARGMTQSRASALVRDGFDRLLDFVNTDPQPANDTFLFGQIEFDSFRGDQPTFETVCALSGKLDRAIADVLARASSGSAPIALQLVGATQCMARIKGPLRSTPGMAAEADKWAEFMRVPKRAASGQRGS